jgi:hypothetical protein
LTFLILGFGLFPQPGVTSRHHAAAEIIANRQLTTRTQPNALAVQGLPRPEP